MDMLVKGAAESSFTEVRPASADELPSLLSAVSGTRMGLGVNLVGPVRQTGFVEAVIRSAATEALSVVVFVAPPAPEGNPDAPGRELLSRTEEYEGTVAAILAVAGRMPASSGLLYLRTPAVIPVALGRYLYGTNWIPMRHHRSDDGRDDLYERFPDPSPA
jgi:hypothetical protein